MSKASRVPCIAMFAVAAIAALSPDRASAQSCGGPNTCIVVTIGGVGTFAAVSYQWGVPGFPSTAGAAPQLNFTRIGDTQSANIMTLVQAQNTAKTADLDVIVQGTVTVNYHMSGVVMSQVLHSGEDPSPNAEAQPFETVVLSFKKLKYTFQPVLPNGQKNGPPVSVDWSFK